MGWRNTELLEVPHMWMWPFRDGLHLLSCGRALLLSKVFWCIHIVFLNVLPSPHFSPCPRHLCRLLLRCWPTLCGSPRIQGADPPPPWCRLSRKSWRPAAHRAAAPQCLTNSPPPLYLVPPTTEMLEAGGPPCCCPAVSEKRSPPFPPQGEGRATVLLIRGI